jgi:hypothetical protein
MVWNAQSVLRTKVGAQTEGSLVASKVLPICCLIIGRRRDGKIVSDLSVAYGEESD